MNISIDLNYFINQIESIDNKELLKYYYEHITKHIEYSIKYLQLKQELLDFISKNKSQQIFYKTLTDNITQSINLVENDAINYKNEFKKTLLKLIQNNN